MSRSFAWLVAQVLDESLVRLARRPPWILLQLVIPRRVSGEVGHGLVFFLLAAKAGGRDVAVRCGDGALGVEQGGSSGLFGSIFF